MAGQRRRGRLNYRIHAAPGRSACPSVPEVGGAAAPQRALALGLEGAIEQDHHGTSFRVHGRIFATQPTADMLRVMLDEAGIRTAVEPHPECCSEFVWGNELACVEVTLGQAT